jgi:hypothetical protein
MPLKPPMNATAAKASGFKAIASAVKARKAAAAPAAPKPPMSPKPPVAAKPPKAPRMPSTPGVGIGVGGTPPGIAKLGAKPGSSAPKMPGVSTPPVSGISAPRTRAPRMGRGKEMI